MIGLPMSSKAKILPSFCGDGICPSHQDSGLDMLMYFGDPPV